MVAEQSQADVLQEVAGVGRLEGPSLTGAGDAAGTRNRTQDVSSVQAAAPTPSLCSTLRTGANPDARQDPATHIQEWGAFYSAAECYIALQVGRARGASARLRAVQQCQGREFERP